MIPFQSRKLLVVILLAGTAAVQACRPTEQAQASAPSAVEILGPANPYQPASRSTKTSENDTTLIDNGSWFEGIARLDSQGAVEVEVIPRQFIPEEGRLDFDVALNTHSVDLSMDVAHLSVLETDTGLTVPAAAWSGQLGGHHISGVLSFPLGNDHKSLLSEATWIEITIVDIDAPERIFFWER
jgi:hypothetical protein